MMMSQEAAERWRDAAILYAEEYLRNEGAEQDEYGNWSLPRREEHDGCLYSFHEALTFVSGEDDHLIREARRLEVEQDVLHQIHIEQGKILRVKPDEIPVAEIHLRDDQYITDFELSPMMRSNPDRKTMDWRWRATIVTPLK